MYECEIWVDIECTQVQPAEVVCTLYGRQSFRIRPLMGERLGFASPKGGSESYKVMMTWGPMQTSGMSTEIEEISHYRGPSAEGEGFTTSLRCRAVRVPSIEDARILANAMLSQHGFELDPYGVNKLIDQNAA